MTAACKMPPAGVDDNNESFNSDNDQQAEVSDERMKEVEKERATLARKESRLVSYMKVAVFVVLCTAFGVVSHFVHDYMSTDQRENFENAFTADALKLLEAFQKAGKRHLEAIDALSVAITSHAKSSGSVFPNVSLPDFGVRFSNARVLSNSFMIYYHPLVTDETKEGYEAYSLENGHIYDEEYVAEVALRKKQNALFNHSEIILNETASQWVDHSIYRIADNGTSYNVAEGTGPYLPLWHMGPLSPDKSNVNLDLSNLPSFNGPYREVLRTKQAVVGQVVPVEYEDERQFYTAGLSWSQFRMNVAEYQNDPLSTSAYPVFDSFDIDNRKVVGILATSVYWKLFFTNVLPKGTRGIICVLENSKGQSYTYQIDDDVKYIGAGNLHDRRFSHMEMNFENLTTEIDVLETTSFTSVPFNTEYCDYWLRIYPSITTHGQHINNHPVGAMLTVDSVFLFTALVFIMYTVAVGRRQKVVMDRALASGAIVSSLFPSQVRDQIYQENDTEKKAATQPFFRRDGHDEHDGMGRPIASVYESTTIMFADMVGFTKWSSSRQPVQVFELLETLYQAFDVIAVRRKVFKVETIGDCYVAVAGLPDPQEDHAVIMARFAAACMTKMGQLTTELVDTLGEDTAALAMRVGLHSGSVTGGVLRGQKSRFQLFGDTMNTASRMESNGMPNRIHVSEETANELIAKGKSSWITPREDKIVAKGKGELQTYWVAIRHGSASVVESLNSDAKESEKAARHEHASNVVADQDDDTYWI